MLYIIKDNFSFFREAEKWTFEEDKIIKELIDPPLTDYSYYPEIFLVSKNYCLKV